MHTETTQKAPPHTQNKMLMANTEAEGKTYLTL